MRDFGYIDPPPGLFSFLKDNPLGVEVCFGCFNGGCLDLERHHARTHVYKSGHTFSLNVKRKLKPSTTKRVKTG